MRILRGAALVASGALILSVLPAHAATSTGPSTTVAPYVIPVASGVDIQSLFTVGDGAADNGYRMVGIPDGLGRVANGSGFTAYANQELRETQGIVRAHGQKGAFVSKLTIDGTGRVTAGSDLMQTVHYWDYASGVYASAPGAPAGATSGHLAAFSRFCSATLSDPGQVEATLPRPAPANLIEAVLRLVTDLLFGPPPPQKVGYAGQLFFTNEENGDEGRVLAIDSNGEAWQLPRLGLASWENNVPAHNTSPTTLVLGDEDGGSGQLWAYVGTKQTAGSPVDRAGLTNGAHFAVDLVDEAVANDVQFRTTYGKNTPVRFDLASVDWNQNGVAQNAAGAANGLSLNRIEDGAWDPSHPSDFYFVTTAGSATSTGRDGGGLWRLRFDDIEKPASGGTLTLLLDGSEAPLLNAPDNVTVDKVGNVLIQEDPGNSDHVARIVAYRIADGARGVVATFDPALFAPTVGGLPNPTLLTKDEESSGIIPLGAGTFLFDAQVHTTTGLPVGTGPGTVEEYVERGQLLTLTIHDWPAVYNLP